MDILVVLENNNGSIHRMSLEAIVAAQKLADEQSLSNAILALGSDTSALANAAKNYNIGEVLTVEHNLLSGYNSDGFAAAVKQVIDKKSPAMFSLVTLIWLEIMYQRLVPSCSGHFYAM